MEDRIRRQELEMEQTRLARAAFKRYGLEYNTDGFLELALNLLQGTIQTPLRREEMESWSDGEWTYFKTKGKWVGVPSRGFLPHGQKPEEFTWVTFKDYVSEFKRQLSRSEREELDCMLPNTF